MTTATAPTETLTALYRRAMAKPCARCNGSRKYTVMETKWYGSRRNGVALTGHQVPKCYVCDRCDGTGKEA